MNKKVLKVWFTDFWSNWDKENNVFMEVLNLDFDVILEKDAPDLIIYSWEGREFENYECWKIYYTPENQLMPKYWECDYSLSFEYWKDHRNLRFPNYLLYGIKGLDLVKKNWDFEQIYDKKEGFCSMVVSNGTSLFRNEFFNLLNQNKPVASGGKFLNNVGGPVANKHEFLTKYRFNLAFENAQHPGYTTEKIVEAMFARTIPLYWGDPEIGTEFNKASFFDVSDYPTTNDFVTDILDHENDKWKFLDKFREPYFLNDQPNEYFDPQRLRKFFRGIVSNMLLSKPIAQQPLKQKVLYPLAKTLRRFI